MKKDIIFGLLYLLFSCFCFSQSINDKIKEDQELLDKRKKRREWRIEKIKKRYNAIYNDESSGYILNKEHVDDEGTYIESPELNLVDFNGEIFKRLCSHCDYKKISTKEELKYYYAINKWSKNIN